MPPRFAHLSRAAFWKQAFVFCLLALTAFAGPVRAQSSQDPVYIFHTNLGNISVQLFPDVTPQTVANFLTYVHSGAYTTSLIHRSEHGFVFQGGSYQIQSNQIVATPTHSPVVNEFHLSNTRGTIAMAKLDNQPNSATSGWFFNESDSNAAILDGENGGFTVFGRVTDSASLAVMDQIAAVPVPNPPPFSLYKEMPIINYQSGAGVKFSQLVTVSFIAPTSGAHVLWNNTSTGAASLWNYTGADASFTQNTYNPGTGYTAKAIADSSTDGRTRVLWDKADGSVSIWNLDNAVGTYIYQNFGPYPGWTASALSVGTDNTTHVLWTNGNMASIWNYNTTSGTFTQNTYGPYPNWKANGIADGPDGKMRVLWNNTDGTASIWSLDNVADVYTYHNFGPYPGWTASALSVGTDNTTHVLWTNGNMASIWNYNTTSGTFTQNTYGPYPNWKANGIADGPDGKMRVLWNNTDSTASIWSLDNVTGNFTQFSFGPYPGWNANAISGGN